jgi:hypothetical protein
MALSDSKKTGSRDISELKQRLGLKKGAAAPTTGQTRANGQSGGVVPPPGLSLPPPPGLAPQQPAPPPMPNAADDPFGAMNAMAAQHIPQRAPEIVLVNDGVPVENVSAESHASTILKIAVPAVVALIIGITVGKIGTGNHAYNESVTSAKAVLGTKEAGGSVTFLKRSLADLDTALDEAKTKHGFKPDLAVDKQLKDLATKLDMKSQQVMLLRAASAARNFATDTAVEQLISFYAGVAEVKDMLDQHSKAAAFDDIALKKAKDAADAANLPADSALAGNLKYAIVASSPTDTDKGADFGARIVELAGVYCGSSPNPVAKCGEGEAPSAVAYRNDPGGPAIKGELASPGTDTVPTKKILTLLPGGVRDGLVKGTEPALSESAYTRRLKAIYDRVHGKPGPDGKPAGGLLEDGNKLETVLQQEANKGSKFSFFM